MGVTPAQYRRTMAILRTALASATMLLVLFCASASAAATVSPLPESNYTVRPVCGVPAPGRASCLALELQPTTAAARARTHPLGITRTTPIAATRAAAEGADGLGPADLRDAYCPGEQPDAPTREPQTIALVDAYNDYAALADLGTYDKEFDLPELTRCTAGQQSGCFEQVSQEGSTDTADLPFPHDQTELTERDEACRTAFAEAQKDGTGLSAAAEQACLEAEEAGGWAVEISTDIEMAHAVCQNCRVLLVEAGKPSYLSLQEVEEAPSYRNLGEAEHTAVALGASEVSNSWAGPEPDREEEQDLERDGIDPFDYPDTVITAAAGDSGYLNWTDAERAEAERNRCLEYARTAGERSECEEIGYSVGANYPASSPDVVAVGGTKLTMNSSGARESEHVWNEDPDPTGGNDGAGGGGCSARFSAPSWQQALPDWTAVGCGSTRAVADVAADADPYTGVAVYDSVPELRVEENTDGNDEIVDTPPAWEPIGGTSVASPIIASMYALAGGAHGVAYPASTLYGHLETSLLHSVTVGGNGACDDIYSAGCSGSMSPTSALYPFDCGAGELICNAAPGCAGHYYDGPTGVGTPNGIAAFLPESHPATDARACEQPSSGGSDSGSGGSGSGVGSGGSTSAPGNGSSEPSSGTGTNTGSGTTGSGTSANTSASTNGPTTGSTTLDTHVLIPTLSALTLTRTATAALSDTAAARVSQIAFAFVLNVAARVHVTLAKLTAAHGRHRWQTLAYQLTLTGTRGHNNAHLRSTEPHHGVLGVLAPGRYRLTLTPVGGTARTLIFQIG
jgi:hypothetical protein